MSSAIPLPGPTLLAVLGSVLLLFLLGALIFSILHRRALRREVREHLAQDLKTKREIAGGLTTLVAGLQQAQGPEITVEEGWEWIRPKASREEIGGLPQDVQVQVDEIVQMFQEGKRFRDLGARIPHGVLLVGPPGVGKTLLAHAIAREIAADSFCHIVGPRLFGPFVGLPSMRLKRLFEQARDREPCVLFFDELEVVGDSRRGTRLSGADTAIHHLLVHLMLELEAIGDRKILVIGATNRDDLLDPALLRLGRFERQIYLDLPGPQSRLEILKIHAKDKRLASDVDLKRIAFGTGFATSTSGFSGADLAEVLNEASIHAGLRRRFAVAAEDVEVAIRRLRRLLLQRSRNEREGTVSRSLARSAGREVEGMRFHDVGGMADAKEKLAMIVEFLRDPELYVSNGCRIPRGILLSGPPGVGKTLIARAVAGEAGVPFFLVSGSEFVEVYVGTAAARIRDLFRLVRRQSPAIVFIDEIDALARRRSSGDHAGNEEYSQAVNQLLVEMDGFEKNDAVVVIAATNRSDVLDEALLRPGRFDDQVEVGLPDEEARDAIFKIHLGKTHALSEPELEDLVAKTARNSGAEIEGLVNAARIHAVRTRRDPVVRKVDFDLAQKAGSRSRSVMLHP
ncbi:MAG TPA: AAA family ATPase [Thermoanaerobaculia bacterium]|nr:AAA family ATPase [Thermoanaerobaculia bacterium]